MRHQQTWTGVQVVKEVTEHVSPFTTLYNRGNENSTYTPEGASKDRIRQCSLLSGWHRLLFKP